MTETDLISEIRHKSQLGAELLYDQYAVLFDKVIFRFVPAVAERERLLTEIFHHIWNDIDNFDPAVQGFSLWAMGCCRAIAKVAMSTEVYGVGRPETDTGNLALV